MKKNFLRKKVNLSVRDSCIKNDNLSNETAFKIMKVSF